MNTARDQIREDMDKRPEQLQREADDVRVDMEHTVDELANQFSPGEMINQAMGMFRGSGDTNFARNLSTQIQNNPVPAILAGVGLTWLMTASKRPPVQGARSGTSSHAMQSAGAKLSSAADRARHSTHNMTESASGMKQRLSDGSHDVKQRLSDSSHQVMDSARTGARSVRSRYDNMLQEQPLMLGAMAIAAGAALGALVPRTQAEDRTMGEVSDEQKEAVRHRAEELQEQAESKVEEKLEKQRSQADRSGDGTGASTSASTSNTTSGPEGQRRDASSPPNAHSQGEARTSTTNSPAAGASGPPGSAPSAGKGDEGVPVANPSSVPNHPDTNPPAQNRREDGNR